LLALLLAPKSEVFVHIRNALPAPASGSAKPIFEYENNVRLPAMSLKQIQALRNDASAYAALCDQLGFSPCDCERLAELEISKRYWARALEWVEMGTAL